MTKLGQAFLAPKAHQILSTKVPLPQHMVISVSTALGPLSPDYSSYTTPYLLPFSQFLVYEFLEVSEFTNDSPHHLQRDYIPQDQKA